MNQDPVVSPAASPEKAAEDKSAQIKMGMEVYDRLGKKVGHVDDLRGSGTDGGLTGPGVVAPVATPIAPSPQPANPAPVIMNTGSEQHVPTGDPVGSGEDLPREMRQRLLHEGYIRIDAGFLKHHRYALLSQIDRVDGDRVSLNVLVEDLIKH